MNVQSYVILTALLGTVICECDDAWLKFGNSCYFFGHGHYQFMDAECFCVHFNAHLANIETKAENDFIRSFLRDFSDPNHWIGMTDELIEGVWKLYPSEQTATFTAWSLKDYQPEQGRYANCVAIFGPAYDYLWVDEPCTHLYRPLCEKPTNSESPIVGR